jgi:hypothetical protein
MSNQIGGDETEQIENVPSVGPSLVGDLLSGQLDSWRVVICKIEKDGDQLLVRGENGHVVERVETDVWTTSGFYDTAVLDLSGIADRVNEAIAREYGEL